MSKSPFPAGAIGRLLALALRALASTWRVDRADIAELERALARPGPLLVGFWHGVYLPLIPLLRGHAGCVFVGEGVRGRWIATICESLGFTPVLLPHHDRRSAIVRMRVALRGDLPCATPLDGPHGPAHRVKPALLEVAAEVGASVLPLSARARPALVLGWRWDLVGTPIPIPEGSTSALRSAIAARIAGAIDGLPGPRAHTPGSVGSRVKGTNATGSS